ncbi:MAG: aldehyde dehydrogenase family protein [Bacteroidetes bacterium]|nr:aldehyde dehydrogenase family protein [Bacteroidota bacterium]
MLSVKIENILSKLGINPKNESVCTGKQWLTALGSETISIISPVDGKKIADVTLASTTEYEKVIQQSQLAFDNWKKVPAPKRGEVVRQIGNKLRENKEELGALVSYEMGKSLEEGLGEVQEMIDICDFACGLSRQLYGLTIASERKEHIMMEQWHPLGAVGIITAFNFPVAVWAWNAMIAAVCGDVCIWKPSEKTPLSAIAVQNIIRPVLINSNIPEGVFNIILGDFRIGEKMAKDTRIQLISATGSTKMGKRVSQLVASRLGKSILELGGNNALIITDDADLKNALKAAVFGSVGTAGQRCTSIRRLIIQNTIYDKFIAQLVKIYKQLNIGNPLNKQNHIGPLIDKIAVSNYQNAINEAENQGAKILYGNKVLKGKGYESGCYVLPTLIEAQNHLKIVQEETFAPITYIMKYNTLKEAIAMQNDVKQGLSSAIFTNNLKEAQYFLSHSGSDCGIANVNIGTSGAEIGGAFGGEKETGGGRESGSDSWKAYMRRQTNTVNYGNDIPLAQGIKFEI